MQEPSIDQIVCQVLHGLTHKTQRRGRAFHLSVGIQRHKIVLTGVWIRNAKSWAGLVKGVQISVGIVFIWIIDEIDYLFLNLDAAFRLFLYSLLILDSKLDPFFDGVAQIFRTLASTLLIAK